MKKDTLLMFDLDGTLWDSAQAVAESWNEVFQKWDPSLPDLTAEDVHGVMGMTMKEISQVLQPGVIFTEDNLPELEEMVVRGDLGGIRELIRDYIVHAENGVLTPECSHNWRIVTP